MSFIDCWSVADLWGAFFLVFLGPGDKIEFDDFQWYPGMAQVETTLSSRLWWTGPPLASIKKVTNHQFCWSPNSQGTNCWSAVWKLPIADWRTVNDWKWRRGATWLSTCDWHALMDLGQAVCPKPLAAWWPPKGPADNYTYYMLWYTMCKLHVTCTCT